MNITGLTQKNIFGVDSGASAGTMSISITTEAVMDDLTDDDYLKKYQLPAKVKNLANEFKTQWPKLKNFAKGRGYEALNKKCAVVFNNLKKEIMLWGKANNIEKDPAYREDEIIPSVAYNARTQELYNWFKHRSYSLTESEPVRK